MNYTISDLMPITQFSAMGVYGRMDLSFDNASTPELSDGNSLTWYKNKSSFHIGIEETNASHIVIGDNFEYPKEILDDKCLILSKSPKLTFSLICNQCLTPNLIPQIHPSSTISSDSKIHESCFIGPNCIIGAAEISENCSIRGNVYIGDNVSIGSNVKIEASAVIGSDGFGYSKDENNKLVPFPHYGGIIIEDEVYIGANTCIDRGSLGNTIIGRGSKIDNLVHISHNANIGQNVVIIANSMIAGSVKIGDDSWVAPSVSILNQKSIGASSTIGMGSVVLKDVEPDSTVTGVPARPMKEFVRIQRLLSKK